MGGNRLNIFQKALRNSIKRSEKDLDRARKQQKFVFWICVVLTVFLLFDLIVYQHIIFLILIPVLWWTLYFGKIGFDEWYRRIIEERKEKHKDLL
jgi:hypothetical protein